MDNRDDISFFYKIDYGGTDSIFDCDVIYRGLRWDLETKKLTLDMIFKDKEVLIYAMKLYHIKKNSRVCGKRRQG